MKVFDCRFRPLTSEFMHYVVPSPVNFEVMKTQPPTPEPLEITLENFGKMGIVKAVVAGRDNESLGIKKVSNDYVAQLVADYPLFIGVAGADPMKGDEALADIEYAVKKLHLKGVSIDPFAYGGDASNRLLYPLYELCSDLRVPVLITIGPIPIRMGYLEWGSPIAIDRVAADFPNLKILASHACFPYTQELIAIVWRHQNVYFESSVYRHMPGANMLVEAVNTIIGEKMCYASAYPFADYKTALPKFLEMGYSDAVLPKILYENAANFFQL